MIIQARITYKESQADKPILNIAKAKEIVF